MFTSEEAAWKSKPHAAPSPPFVVDKTLTPTEGKGVRWPDATSSQTAEGGFAMALDITDTERNYLLELLEAKRSELLHKLHHVGEYVLANITVSI